MLSGRRDVEYPSPTAISAGQTHKRFGNVINRRRGHFVSISLNALPRQEARLEYPIFSLQLVIPPSLAIRPHQAQPKYIARNTPIPGEANQPLAYPFTCRVSIEDRMPLVLYRGLFVYGSRRRAVAGTEHT